MTSPRIQTQLKKAEIIKSALDLAEQCGYANVTSTALAVRVNSSAALIFKYFGTTFQLRKIILKTAISQNNFTIIAQALVAKDPLALKLPLEIKQKALSTLL